MRKSGWKLKNLYKKYKVNRILNVLKHVDGGWFWNKYSAHQYLGCEYGCAYCYCRDEKYNPHKPGRDPNVTKFEDPFSQYIKIKENAPQLLEKELRDKPKDLIYLNGYQPIEAKCRLARKMLEVCLKLRFPVFINEKSPLLLRDLDILKQLNHESYVNVGWSVITAWDDDTRKIFEPKAPPIRSRFKAMKKLSSNKIYTGTVFMPILPYIYDDDENIKAVIKKTRDSGGKYVLEGGLTLWGYCKTYYYKTLEKYDSTLKEKYEKLYNNPNKLNEYAAQIHQKILEYCNKYNLTPYIPRPIKHYPKELQINKKIAEKLYLEARELQLSAQAKYKEWAYRKAAWAIDNLNESLQKIYQKMGIKGLMQIKGIGKNLANTIIDLLQTVKV